jgi:predicted CopG family antitoxin
MSKSIKLQDETYYRLQDYTSKGETYDQAIIRLLSLAKQVKKLAEAKPVPTGRAQGTGNDKEDSHGT